MAYAGGTPELVSENFGKETFRNAVAGNDGSKYYVSMQSDKGWKLFVLDINKGLWHIEDNTQALDFAYCAGVLYYIDADTKQVIQTTTSAEDEHNIPWSCTLGEFDEFVEEKKIYSKILMRLKLEDDADITIYVRMDGLEWKPVSQIYAERKRAVYIPIIPTRCNKFQIKIEGHGNCKIESLVRQYREGSATG